LERTSEGFVRDVGVRNALLQLLCSVRRVEEVRHLGDATRELKEAGVELQDIPKSCEALRDHCGQIAHGKHSGSLQACSTVGSRKCKPWKLQISASLIT
jgi:hypothetical protein